MLDVKTMKADVLVDPIVISEIDEYIWKDLWFSFLKFLIYNMFLAM